MDGKGNLTVTREVADGAQVASNAHIGPFCTIGPDVVVGPRTVLGRRVTVLGRTNLGCDNVIGDGSALGLSPQDLKYCGTATYLIIGDRNHFGPNCTAHVGTESGGYLTRIGSDNILDAGAHVAHDCYVDDHTHLGAWVLLAGHVRVETGAVIEESCGAHHFTTIGAYSRVGARTPIRRDVPPFSYFTSFGLYTAPPAPRGAHEQGIQRAGLPEQERAQLRQAIQHLFENERALALKVEQMLADDDLPQPLRQLCEFCRRSLRGRFGRHRESFRGKLPPEAAEHLPPEFLAQLPAREGANGQ